MNKREKILACIVALLLLVAGAGYTTRSVSEAFRTRRQRVSQLEKDLREKKQFDQLTQEYRERMEVYQSRSLPRDAEEARSMYQAWLVDRAVEVGFVDPLVKPDPRRTSSNVYTPLKFNIVAKGDLQQMVTFLYKFYSVDLLHRVSDLRAKRVPGSKQLDLRFTVDALSLPTSPNEELRDEPSPRLAHESLEAYRDVIVYRNLFGPPNNPPTLDTIGEITGYKGRTVEFTVAASDRDKLDKVFVHIDGDGLPGAHLDEESGRFEWRPEELGEYEVHFEATDDGWPPKSASQIAKIKVTDAPPEERMRALDFEKAKFAYVTAITEVSGRKQTWINLRTEGKVLKLNEGDQFVVGDVQVTVKRIDEKSVELEAETLQKRLLVSLGQNLAEGNLLPTGGG